MSVKIFLDSSTDVAPKIKGSFEWIPLSVYFGEERFRDGVDLTHAEFYTRLLAEKELPKTSQATPGDFLEKLGDSLGPGDSAVIISLSKKLSGTFQSATIAAESFPGRVFAVDSDTVTIGAGILAEYALNLANSGISPGEIAKKLNEIKGRVRLIAQVDTLEYLKKGGRISKTVAFAGELLNFKPVICVEEGEVKMLGKARGAKQGNNLLEQEIEKAGGVDFGLPILLGYSGTDGSMLKRYIEDFSHIWKDKTDSFSISEIGTVVGTHAGPGAIAAAFFSRR